MHSPSLRLTISQVSEKPSTKEASGDEDGGESEVEDEEEQIISDSEEEEVRLNESRIFLLVADWLRRLRRHFHLPRPRPGLEKNRLRRIATRRADKVRALIRRGRLWTRQKYVNSVGLRVL
jgi:hypothetical protein